MYKNPKIHNKIKVVSKPFPNGFYIDMESIPLEELKRQYIDYSYQIAKSKHGAVSMVESLNNQTYSATLTAEEIREKYNLANWQCAVCIAKNDIEVILIIPNLAGSKDLIIIDMEEKYGYFVGKESIYTRNGMEWLQIQFEPNVSANIDDIKNDYVLYHISPSYNRGSIEKFGILPTDENEINGIKNTNRPKQVFLLRGYTTMPEWEMLAKTLNNSRSADLKTNSYDIFMVMLNKLPDNIKFSGDPELANGVSTRSAIPSSSIIYFGSFKI